MRVEIEVAAYGWQGAAWDPFYPQDLPAEWRLGYYANAFFAVIVPADHWRGEDEAVLLAWLDELHAGFRCYWELTSGTEAARLRRLQAGEPRFAAHFGGWLWREQEGWRSETEHGPQAILVLQRVVPLRALREAIEAAAPPQGGLLILVAPEAQGLLPALLPLSQMLAGEGG